MSKSVIVGHIVSNSVAVICLTCYSNKLLIMLGTFVIIDKYV